MRKVWIIFPTLFALCAMCFNVISFASTGTVGSDLYAIGQKTNALRRENTKLADELASIQSLGKVLDLAHQEGYLEISSLTRVEEKNTQVAMEMAH